MAAAVGVQKKKEHISTENKTENSDETWDDAIQNGSEAKLRFLGGQTFLIGFISSSIETIG